MFQIDYGQLFAAGRLNQVGPYVYDHRPCFFRSAAYVYFFIACMRFRRGRLKVVQPLLSALATVLYLPLVGT